MAIKELLEYQLINTDKFTIDIYSLIIALLILIVSRVIIWMIKRVFRKNSYISRAVESGKRHALYQIIKYIIWITAILLVLDTVGIKITFFLAGSAALLVGLGFGLQEIFKDIVSGLFMLFEGNIKVNDVVELDDQIGKVKEIGFRTTKIESRDNIILIIPNSKFINGNVINWSHIQKLTRFHVNVGIAYGSDVKKVKEVLMACAKKHDLVTKIPAPFVRFNDFGNSSLDFQLFFWTDDAFYVENIKSDLRFVINQKFAENNITIPFPQHDIHIKSKV